MNKFNSITQQGKAMSKGFHSPTRNGDSTGVDSDMEFPCYTAQKVINRHTIFVDNAISSVQDFRYALQVFSTAQEDDEILVILNTPGGLVDAAQAFISGMMNCNAEIFVSGSGTIASAGAIILSACDNFTLDPFCSVMYHPCTGGYGGTMEDVAQYGEFQKKQTEDLLNYYAIGILTEEDLRQIHVEKKTIWLNTDQFVERFKRKVACQDMLTEHVENVGIASQAVTPQAYVGLMKLMLKQYEEQKAKPTKKAKAKKPVSIPSKECCGDAGCSC